MRNTKRRMFALITFVLVLISMWAPNSIYANSTMTPTTIYAQIELSTDEIEVYEEASLIYADVTYYGARETETVWRFMIDATEVDVTTIDQVTLYNNEGVPYSFPSAVYAFEMEELADESSEPGDDGTETVPDVETPIEPPLVEPEASPEEPVTEEPVTEEVTEPSATPDVTSETDVTNEMIGLEVGKEANIDQAVVGGMIPYTFVIENTGETTLTITSIEDEFFSGDIDADKVEAFNADVREQLMALIGKNGLAAGERVETTVHLTIPSDYDRTNAPEIGNVFRVAATDTYGRVIDAESQQIVLLNQADFTVTKTARPETVHPGETIRYTYTITNTSNVTLYFVDVIDEWTSGALTTEEQRETTETLRDGMRALAEIENGLVPGEGVVLEMEKVLLPSYDVRAGAILTNRTTFTFEVNREARVSRTVEATVHVKQHIPKPDNDNHDDQDESVYVPEPTTPVTPDQATLPMTGSTETRGTVIGLILIGLGLLFVTHRRRPTSKA
ncbi:DUF11 domain-containing protein [Exiguobacterium sp. SL-10]|uniref:DUF7507 domain-containing protein n=1 Tax=Exiguobacterium sp. SL-10 TaxID=2510962 RepID=UPI00103B973E|nr:DUF11 domain-containing protein [Exiguobacterium sp. SL-10]TCI29034.1 DUF11 domain-containing protein [Exiguobacterium sp. SL-10]